MPTQSGVTSVQVVLGDREFVGQLIAADEAAKQSFDAAEDGLHLLLTGPRDYHVIVEGADQASVQEGVGHRVLVRFDGRRGLRRKLEAVRGEAPPLDLTGGLHGAAPLYLLSEGTLSSSADGEAPRGLDALDTMVTAARWISSRRSSSFERLFPPSPFHPDLPERPERLSVAQGAALLDQVDAVLAAAAVSAAEGDEARAQAVQLRSACVTVLSHVVATVLKDPEFRDLADRAAARILALIEAEAEEGGRPELRNHALMLLQMRGPALSEAHAAQVKELLAGYTRKSPPYAQLPKDVWRFGFASAYDFHPGEYEILRDRYKYTEMAAPEGAPTPPGWRGYEILKAPFAGPDGQEIQIWTRTTSPRDENFEMGHEYFVGLAISRHANLGANDMAASQVAVEQRGYKLMLNAQCAGLTTRFAISRMFPDADIYSSWDSTYFRTGEGHKIVDSEACDCLHALLQGFAKGEDFAGIDARIREAQWYHRQQRVEGFVQFIGPAHPAVVSRYEDINHDGKADFYDGFLDFQLVAIAEDARAGGVPRDPGVAGSQVSGEAARGLGWSAGSMNRVTQYSELWDELPGEAERFYAFRGAGFFGPGEPPTDVPTGKGPEVPLGQLPAVIRYTKDAAAEGGLAADVMFNAWLSHSPSELKRLLIAAEAFWRAIDLGYLGGRAPLDTIAGQRAGLLLTLASLLEFPADQNRLGQIWDRALQMLNLPPISLSKIRRCNTEEDHHSGNYYGSRRAIRQLLGLGGEPGELERADPLAHEKLHSDDPRVGRLLTIDQLSALATADDAPAQDGES